MTRATQHTEDPARAVLPGTRPAGVQNESEAGRQIRDMFSRIAPRYDFLNHFLSASMDKLWRRRTAARYSHILGRPGARVLDLCCGTGDLLFAFERAARDPTKNSSSQSSRFIGADFALPMLSLANQKAAETSAASRFLAADALALPFAGASFDLLGTAFGFRNLSNYSAGLREIARVLRRGGEVAILDFCEPRSGPLAAPYRLYFTKILPRLGGAISGSSAAYTYLPASVEKFPPPELLQHWMEEAGFREVQFERWTCGIVALHRGVKS